MTGKFVNEKLHANNDSSGRWYFELLDPVTKKKHKLHYHDTRNFGTLKFCLSKAQLETKLQTLGPDVLEASTTEDVFLGIVSNKNPTLNICRFLMNQTVSELPATILEQGQIIDKRVLSRISAGWEIIYWQRVFTELR